MKLSRLGERTTECLRMEVKELVDMVQGLGWVIHGQGLSNEGSDGESWKNR